MPSTFNTKQCQSRRRSSRLSTINRTRDNIVIFKVFAEYSDKNISKQTLIRQFESFGKMKDFSVVARYNRRNICKVTYYDPKSAAHLLRSSYIRLNQSHIMIKPCPTWEQPLQVTSYNENDISNESSALKLNSSEPLCDILSLNDDCLEIIFNYLDLKSQLRFSLCHDRLEQVFIYMICPRTKELNVADLSGGKFSNWEVWQFFKTAGQYVTKIKFLSYFRNIGFNLAEMDTLEMIEEFSTNVQSLQLIQRYRNTDILNYFNINLITEIELYSCGLVDNDCKTLVQCRNLTSLGLAKNQELTGALLPCFEKLQHLSLYNCHHIKFENLLEACEKMNLEYLNISKIPISGRGSELFKHCPKLNTIKMNKDATGSLEQTVFLENLKSLELHLAIVFNSFEKYNSSLEILKLFSVFNNISPTAVAKFSSLRVLWLCSEFEAHIESKMLKSVSTLKELEEFYVKPAVLLNDNDFLHLVKNCLKLKRLCITDCKKLKNNFITSSYDVLENRKHNSPTTSSAAASQKPLTIFLNNTGIKSSFIWMFNTRSNNKLLKVTKFSGEPMIGFLDDDLPFDVPPKNCVVEDDSGDSSEEDYSSYSEDDDDLYYAGDEDDYDDRYYCNLM